MTRSPRCRAGGEDRRAAFSLLELMIAIIILGLGLVMVATMFPVAWNRARELSDFTVQKASLSNAAAASEALLHAGGPPGKTSSFVGDLILVDALTAASTINGSTWYSDNWVHALNLENLKVDARQFDDEQPWALERARDLKRDPDPSIQQLASGSYQEPQIRFHQRLQPPARRREGVVNNVLADPDEEWDEGLDTRRFAWGVLHRLREPIADPAETRSFDMYYVLLRRAQSTYRFAVQDPASVPNPIDLTLPPVTPRALGPVEDVMLPVPWRVQVQFPDQVPRGSVDSRNNATGIPTEITVPPPGVGNGAQLVQMFQRGTVFVDEVEGHVFRVAKRRLTGANLDSAVLTLDREVFIEDLDLAANDARCVTCVPFDLASPNVGLDPAERLRTVWVYPPPVEARGGAGEPLAFVGNPPVVDIEVRSLTLGGS